MACELQAIYALESDSANVGEAYWHIRAMDERIDSADELPMFFEDHDLLKVKCYS